MDTLASRSISNHLVDKEIPTTAHNFLSGKAVCPVGPTKFTRRLIRNMAGLFEPFMKTLELKSMKRNTDSLSRRFFLGLFASATLLIWTGSVSATYIVLEVDAYIDGRDQLILNDNTLQWHHYDWAAVGRFQGNDAPTYISLWEDGVQYLNDFAWTPTWADPPPNEIRYEAYSSVFTGFNFMPNEEASVKLTPLAARDLVSVVQLPSLSNAYELVVEFNDNPSPAADWYSARIEITTTQIPLPSPLALLGLGIAGIGFVHRKLT